jgi:hypothetical protein
MFKFPWQKPEEITREAIEQRRRKYEEYAVYVTDEETRKAMLAGLDRVSEALDAKDPVAAKSHIEIVKHAYAMARYRNKVLKYKSFRGGAIACDRTSPETDRISEGQ